MPVDAQWLAQVEETPLDPDLPTIDPHHHLWDRPGDRYMLDELLGDTNAGHNIVATVFVECMSMYRARGRRALRPIGETEFVNGIAAQSASGIYGDSRICDGIVGFADLTLGAAVDEVLDAHLTAAPARFRGIRHAAGWDADERVRNSHTKPIAGLFKTDSFRAGFQRLARYGLSFEAWLYHHQIGDVVDLATRHPDTTIILNHFGGPLGIGPYEGQRAAIVDRWRHDIEQLAACPNVFAKLGGLNMPINGFDWHKQSQPPTSDMLVMATQDYYHHTIACFGPNRCMFESNFPVDKQSCSYVVLWNAFKKIAARHSAADKTAMFHDTAARVYRLTAET